MTHQSSDHANVVQNRRKRKIRREETDVLLDGNDDYDDDACNDTNVCDESDADAVDMNAVIDIGSNSCSDDTTTDDDDDDASGILWLQHQSTASSPLPATAFTIDEHIMIQYFQTAIQSHDYTETQFLKVDDSVVTTFASPRCCTTNNGSSDGGNNNNNNVLSNSSHKEQQQQPNDHAVQLWTPNELDLPLWAVMASTMAPLSKMPGSL
jgi:hypothetical protein